MKHFEEHGTHYTMYIQVLLLNIKTVVLVILIFENTYRIMLSAYKNEKSLMKVNKTNTLNN